MNYLHFPCESNRDLAFVSIRLLFLKPSKKEKETVGCISEN